MGHIKMFPLAWRKLLRSVYKSMSKGSPARDYILTNLHEYQKELREAYGNAPKIIDQYVEKFFSDDNRIKKMVKK
jgi:hypothetical protein